MLVITVISGSFLGSKKEQRGLNEPAVGPIQPAQEVVVPQPVHTLDDGIPGITPVAPLPLVPLIELPAAPLSPGPLVEQPTAPLSLAEPPEQLPEVPAAVADVPLAPHAALPYTARRGTIDRGASGTSATAAGTSGSCAGGPASGSGAAGCSTNGTGGSGAAGSSISGTSGSGATGGIPDMPSSSV